MSDRPIEQLPMVQTIIEQTLIDEDVFFYWEDGILHIDETHYATYKKFERYVTMKPVTPIR